MRPHRTIRLLLVAFLIFVLCVPGIAGAGPGSATAGRAYHLFHPQFIKNDVGASSTLYLQSPSAGPAFVSLEFYSESGESEVRGGSSPSHRTACSL